MLCYQVTNVITGKVYIGLTTMTLAERWAIHVAKFRHGGGFALHAAMRKHGIENFVIEEIAAPIIKDRAELAELERTLIAQAGSMAPHGYNLTAGGDGVSGCDEVRKKIGAARRGKLMTDEQKARMSAAAKTRKPRVWTDEARANMSAAQKARTDLRGHTAESREKCRVAGLKRKPIPMTPEHQAKLLAIHVGRKQSPEEIEKRRQSALGRKYSDEAKASMKAAQQARRAAERETKALIASVSEHTKEGVE